MIQSQGHTGREREREREREAREFLELCARLLRDGARVTVALRHPLVIQVWANDESGFRYREEKGKSCVRVCVRMQLRPQPGEESDEGWKGERERETGVRGRERERERERETST